MVSSMKWQLYCYCFHLGLTQTQERNPLYQQKKRCHTSPTHPCSSTAAGSSTTAATAAKKGKGKAPKTQRVAKKRASAPTQLYVGEDEDKWHNVSDEDEQPHLPSFQPKRAPGPQLISTATYSPLQLFQLFFSISVVTSIVDNTNRYAAKRKKAGAKFAWTPLTVTEFYAFVALIIHMGLVNLKTLADYWSQKQGYRLGFPRSVMSKARFFAISWCLPLCDPEGDEENNKKREPNTMTSCTK